MIYRGITLNELRFQYTLPALMFIQDRSLRESVMMKASILLVSNSNIFIKRDDQYIVKI